MPGANDRACSSVPGHAANYGAPCSTPSPIGRTLAVLMLLILRLLLVLRLLLGLRLLLILCLLLGLRL